MQIIPALLSEEDVCMIQDDELAVLAKCSTDVILKYILDYLQDIKADSTVRGRVQKAYSGRIRQKETLDNEELKEQTAAVAEIDYDSISLLLTEDELKEKRELIIKVLDNESLVPYVTPIHGSVIDEFLEERKRDSEPYRRAVWLRLYKHRQYFKSARNAKARGTFAKRVVLNRDKYELILYGTNFMLDKKAKGENPNSWRFI